MTKLEIFTRIALGEMPEERWFDGWEYHELREIANEHRVLCLIAKWYPDQKTAIDDLRNATLRELQIKSLTSKLISELNQKEIEAFSYKGPNLQEKLNDPFPRESRDIDLLLKKSEVVKAYNLLSQSRIIAETPYRVADPYKTGWLPQKDLIIVNESPKIRIEIHWSFSVQYLKSNVTDRFWISKEQTGAFDESIEFEALVDHAFTHGFARIRWVRDLELMRRIFGFEYPNSIAGRRTAQFIETLKGKTTIGFTKLLQERFTEGIESGHPKKIDPPLQRRILWQLCPTPTAKVQMILVHANAKLRSTYFNWRKI